MGVSGPGGVGVSVDRSRGKYIHPDPRGIHPFRHGEDAQNCIYRLMRSVLRLFEIGHWVPSKRRNASADQKKIRWRMSVGNTEICTEQSTHLGTLKSRSKRLEGCRRAGIRAPVRSQAQEGEA